MDDRRAQCRWLMSAGAGRQAVVVVTLTMLKRTYVGISIKILTEDRGRLQEGIYEKGARSLNLIDLPTKEIFTKCKNILKFNVHL